MAKSRTVLPAHFFLQSLYRQWVRIKSKLIVDCPLAQEGGPNRDYWELAKPGDWEPWQRMRSIISQKTGFSKEDVESYMLSCGRQRHYLGIRDDHGVSFGTLADSPDLPKPSQRVLHRKVNRWWNGGDGEKLARAFCKIIPGLADAMKRLELHTSATSTKAPVAEPSASGTREKIKPSRRRGKAKSLTKPQEAIVLAREGTTESWEKIGGAIGISAQAAQQRYKRAMANPGYKGRRSVNLKRFKSIHANISKPNQSSDA